MRLRPSQFAQRGGGADQIGLFDFAVADLVEVEPEPGQQRQPEPEMNLTGCRYRERDDAGDQQESQFHAVCWLQCQTGGFPGSGLARHQDADQNHDGPAQAHQQPVRPGHVGRRVLRVFSVVPGHIGVVEVDRVFGQDRDQGEERRRQPAGHIDLGGLGGPGEQEAGRHHRGPEDQQGGHRAGVQAGDPDDDGRGDECAGDQPRTGQGATPPLSRHRDVVSGPVNGEHRHPSRGAAIGWWVLRLGCRGELITQATRDLHRQQR